MRRGAVVAVVAALAAGVLPPAAQAQASIHCGTVVKRSIKLDRDLLECPGNGLVVGASNITINLGGHLVASDGAGDGAGILNDAAYRGVTVRNGTIRFFEEGILLDSAGETENTFEDLTFEGNGTALLIDGAKGNTVQKNELNGNGDGIVVLGDGNSVVKNDVFDEDSAIRIGGNANLVEKNDVVYSVASDQGPAIEVEGDDNSVVKNDLLAGEHGIGVEGDDNLVASNKLEGGSGDGIVAEGSGNEISDNDVEAYGGRGIVVVEEDSTRNVIAGNDVELSGKEGILAEGNRTVIDDNDVEENGGDGIRAEGDDVTITDNDARDNGFAGGDGYGIRATGRAVAGSGNDARDNANPAQCAPASLCD